MSAGSAILLMVAKPMAMLVLVEVTIRLLSRYARPDQRPWMLVAAISIAGFGLALL